MNNKQKYGQFFTTNYKYILQNFKIPNNIKNIIEPFVGNEDLLNFIDVKEYYIEKYDIEPQNKDIIKRDTILDPPNYNNKFVLTNPPYLARNKNKDKTLYNKYNVNDLYKCFLVNLLNSNCLGGIIIIPLNFFSSIRKNDIILRKKFLDIYNIKKINIFEEKVFKDTSYTICSLLFELKNNKFNDKNIKLYIYPSKKELTIQLNDINNYTIGGKIYLLKLNKKIYIDRLTKKNKNIYKDNITNIKVNCIDNNEKDKIKLYLTEEKNRYIDNTEKLSARTFATLIIRPNLNTDQQKKLIIDFNKYLDDMRKKYNSLFLTNYRESKKIARKRISFKLVYNICNYLLSNK